MTSRRKRANRWLAVAASVMVALGSMLVIEGTASAATPIAHFPVIRFWPAYHKVTLNVPARAWCPKSKPKCVWELFVNEPDIPAQTVVGIATGSSGILMVDYPNTSAECSRQMPSSALRHGSSSTDTRR